MDLKLGDIVYYRRFHNGERVTSPAIVVEINTPGPTPEVGLWVLSHPLPQEAYPLFWRAAVPFRADDPADGSHCWTWR